MEALSNSTGLNEAIIKFIEHEDFVPVELGVYFTGSTLTDSCGLQEEDITLYFYANCAITVVSGILRLHLLLRSSHLL